MRGNSPPPVFAGTTRTYWDALGKEAMHIDVEPWTQQAGEPSRGFHGFAHYRDLGSERSVDKAWRAHKNQCDHLHIDPKRRANKTYFRWAAKWGWVERAELYDQYVDQQVRQKLIRDQTEAKARHARLAQGTLTALTAPVRATLEALADPQVVQQLSARVRSGTDGALAVISLLTRVAQVMPSLMSMERLALGMTTESIEVDEKRELSFATQIAKDPRATDLAIQLLDRLAGTGSDALTSHAQTDDTPPLLNPAALDSKRFH
jgi:hypothetical protein